MIDELVRLLGGQAEYTWSYDQRWPGDQWLSADLLAPCGCVVEGLWDMTGFLADGGYIVKPCSHFHRELIRQELPHLKETSFGFVSN